MNYKGKPLISKTSNIYSLKGGNSYQKFRDFNKKGKYDIIVIGSSHAYRGFDPRNFKKEGINMFNLGTSGQTPLNSYYIAKNYITPENCKMVLLDVYDGTFHNNGFEASSDLIQNITSTKATFEMASSFTNPQILNMLALRFINFNSPPKYVDSMYVGNGYSQKNDTITYSLPFEEYENRYLPSEVQEKYLDKILQYFKEKNIPVIMTTLPFPKEKKKKQHDAYYQLFSSVALKYKVTYLDYSFNTNFDSQLHFYDSHHLNQRGVDLFNDILIKDLKKLNYIK